MATSPVQSWQPGMAVAQYVLVRELARGGMGEVWLARQGEAGGFERLVALKRVLAGADADSAAMTMFLDEARIAAQLQHPNIVQVFDFGRDAGSVFLVMEYLAGQTVGRLKRRLLEVEEPLSPSLAVAIVSAAARGLGYAHRRTSLEGQPLKIVHRDVSPQNLFVTYDGEVKVLDFGIALAAGRLGRTMEGTIKGKVAYMSPEQTAGGALPVTGAADVFALGIVLFELVTGSRYYEGADDHAILLRLAMMEAPPRPSARAAVPADLEALILRALAPEPKDRFADGQRFFEALEAWRHANPIAPGEPSLQQVMTKAFAEELKELGELHRQAVRTPMGSSPVARKPADSEETRARPARVATAPRAAVPAPPIAQNRTVLEVHTEEVAPPAQKKTVLDRPARSEHGEPPAVVPKKTVLDRPSKAIEREDAPVGKSSARGLAFAGLTVGVLLLVVAAWALTRSPAVVAAPSVAPKPVVVAPPVVAAVVPEPPIVPVAVEPEPAPPAEVVADAGPPVAAPPSGQRAVATGLLSLDSDPWTSVFLGKRALGDTPLVEVLLPVGRHRLRLVNSAEKVDSFIEVTIKARETTVKKIAF